MLAAAHGVEVGEHRDVIQHLIERGGINAVAEQVSMGTRPKMCIPQRDVCTTPYALQDCCYC